MDDHRSIIFFDGNCMLCNSFISYLVKKKHPNLFFCDINTETANKILAAAHIHNATKNTIYFLQGDRLYYKSTAVLKIISQLTPFYKFMASISLLIPLFIRDSIYSLIAKNRYHLFKQGTCYIPSPEEKDKFL